MKNGVNCSKCDNTVMPRLWHEDMNSIMFHRSNKHICPICGVTMYTTGGGLTLIGNVIFHIAAVGLIWVVSAIVAQEMFNLSNSASEIFAWVILFITSSLYVAKRVFGIAISSLILRKNPRTK